MAADQNLKARSIPRTHTRSIPHDPYPWSISLKRIWSIPTIHTHDPYPWSIPMIHTWVIASVGDALVLFLNCICRIPKFVLPHVFWGWGPICLASAYLPRICRLTIGQWKTCAMSLAAWPVGPPIPFQLGLALGRVNVWCSTTVSSVVLIHHTIPHHTIPVLAQARPSKKQTGSFFLQARVHFVPYTVPYPFHAWAMPCETHPHTWIIPRTCANHSSIFRI